MKTTTKGAKGAKGTKATVIEFYKFQGEVKYNSGVIRIPRYGFSPMLIMEYLANYDSRPNITGIELPESDSDFFRVYLTGIDSDALHAIVEYINANN